MTWDMGMGAVISLGQILDRAEGLAGLPGGPGGSGQLQKAT